MLKPGPLDNDEWAVMQRHPVYAYELLSPIAHLRPSLDIPYYHHEKWNGTGYPTGISGTQIPLAARIFAVVDVYDALTHNRPYHRAHSAELALTIIAEQSGLHFDPEIVSVFLDLMEQRGLRPKPLAQNVGALREPGTEQLRWQRQAPITYLPSGLCRQEKRARRFLSARQTQHYQKLGILKKERVTLGFAISMSIVRDI
ncbi:HD domain-containing protein [Candidatus Gracilibacteria bacterium]|nr:HD domain-containing protein [Candidatus Gracilibacteria bacterium]